MSKKFGGYKIYPDEDLARVIGTRDPVSPSEMTKRIWRYVKFKRLGKK